MPRVRPNIRERVAAAKRTPDEQARAAAHLTAYYRKVFSGPEGQEVLADLLRKTGVLMPSPNDETEGARKVGLYILDQITRDPADLVKFMLTTETGDLLNERDNATH